MTHISKFQVTCIFQEFGIWICDRYSSTVVQTNETFVYFFSFTITELPRSNWFCTHHQSDKTARFCALQLCHKCFMSDVARILFTHPPSHARTHPITHAPTCTTDTHRGDQRADQCDGVAARCWQGFQVWVGAKNGAYLYVYTCLYTLFVYTCMCVYVHLMFMRVYMDITHVYNTCICVFRCIHVCVCMYIWWVSVYVWIIHL